MEPSRKRLQELDRLFTRIYEDNALGKLSDEWDTRMHAAYESVQKELLAAVESEEQTVQDMEQERIDLHQPLNAMRECTDLKELTSLWSTHGASVWKSITARSIQAAFLSETENMGQAFQPQLHVPVREYGQAFQNGTVQRLAALPEDFVH